MPSKVQTKPQPIPQRPKGGGRGRRTLDQVMVPQSEHGRPRSETYYWAKCTVRMPAELLDALQERARRNVRSLQGEIVSILLAAVPLNGTGAR